MKAPLSRSLSMTFSSELPSELLMPTTRLPQLKVSISPAWRTNTTMTTNHNKRNHSIHYLLPLTIMAIIIMLRGLWVKVRF